MPANQKRLSAIKITGVALLVILVGSSALLLGFEIGYNRMGPANVMYKVDQQFTRFVRLFVPKKPERKTRQINSGLVRLSASIAEVPKDITSSIGGGLASFGKDVLLVTQSGAIYRASSRNDISKTNIATPDNGYKNFASLIESEAFSDYSFRLSHLRYNDLLSYNNDSGRYLLLSYSAFDPAERCFTNQVAQLSLGRDIDSISEATASAEDWQVIYRSQPCLPFKKDYLAYEGHMAGGRLAFRPPHDLYLGNGDFHWDGMRSSGEAILAQDTATDYGKIIHIDLSNGNVRKVSMGHRNPQGISFDKQGELYVLEHGPKGGDELNHIPASKAINNDLNVNNYGWPLESLGITYQSLPIPGSLSYGRHDNFQPPVFAWMPSVATSSLSLIDGFHTAWDGDFLAGSLIDRSLHRIRIQDGRAIYSERISVGEKIRDVHQHSDGRIVLWTDSHKLLFLSAIDNAYEFAFIDQHINGLNLEHTRKRQLRQTILACAECHSFSYGDDNKAPNLSGIYGAKAGSTAYAGYSQGLSQLGVTWDDNTLAAYLRDPQALVPGTYMPGPEIQDEQLLTETVVLLKALAEQF